MKYAPVPDNEFWRIPLLHNLLAVRGHDWTVDNFDNGELNQMIYNVCTTWSTTQLDFIPVWVVKEHSPNFFFES